MPTLPTRSTRSPSQYRLLFHGLLIACSLALAACGTSTTETLRTTPGVAAVATATPVTLVTPSPDIAPTLQAAREVLIKTPVTLTAGEQRWQPSAAELGATVDVAGNALRVTVDQAKLRVYLAQLTPSVGTPAVDATVAVVDGAFQIEPAATGTTLDNDAAVQAITAVLQRATAGQVVLATKPQAPKVTDAAAAEALGQAQTLVQQPLALKVGTQQYTWDAKTLTALLAFTATDTGKLQVTLDRTALASQLATLAATSVQPATEPRVSWNGGQLQIFAPGQHGVRLDEAKAVDVLISGFAMSHRLIDLPVQTIAPQVTSATLDTLGIQDVVSIGKSDFSGSAAYRITNIIVGMKLLNGTLIAPGAEFSFNNTVGEIDERSGFVEGHAIVNNHTQLEFGGGICQDSTTVFRAAFWAGLPITERKEHTFYISWYNRYGLGPLGDGPGLDAAIYTGVQDMRFLNDTGNWLLMQTSADPKTAVAQVTLYGTKPNRAVTITQDITKRTPAIAKPEYYGDPQQPAGTIKRTDTARGGMTIVVYRTIMENGVAREPELFRTIFRPWSNKYAVNPADIGPGGIPVFLMPPRPAPTPDPALAPTADPNVPVPEEHPTAEPVILPSADPAPTVDPAIVPTPAG